MNMSETGRKYRRLEGSARYDGHRRRGHQHQHARGVGAALGLHVRSEGDRHEKADSRDEHDERPGRAGPVRRHAVARKVLRHEVQQPGHGGGAGEPERGNRRDVVDRAEGRSEIPVRQKRQRASVRRAAFLQRGRGNPGCDRD